MGEQVVVFKRFKFLVLNVHDDDVLLLVAEHLGQMCPDFSRAGNNDSHIVLF